MGRLRNFDLGVQGDQAAIRKIVLSTGLGAIFGFQISRLAEFGFGISPPWYGSVWMFLGHVMLGFTIGATARFARWWMRGLVLGLLFSTPLAWGGHALGVRWMPYGVAMITAGVVDGLLLAFLTDALCPRTDTSSGRPFPLSEQLAGPQNSHCAARNCGRNGQRLAEEKACLERLDAERKRRGDSGFGKATEDRVVWRELLELELQDIDEQVSRIRGAAGGVTGRHPRCDELPASGPQVGG